MEVHVTLYDKGKDFCYLYAKHTDTFSFSLPLEYDPSTPKGARSGPLDAMFAI